MNKWPRSGYQSSVQDSRSFDGSVDDDRSVEFIHKDAHDLNHSVAEGKKNLKRFLRFFACII